MLFLFYYFVYLFSLVNSNYHQPTSTMKRDYYRGSQDSLADRGLGSSLLHKGVFFYLFIFLIYVFFSL